MIEWFREDPWRIVYTLFGVAIACHLISLFCLVMAWVTS